MKYFKISKIYFTFTFVCVLLEEGKDLKMHIQNISQQNFTTRLLKNKTVLKTLEKISDHGTSFSAGTSLALSLVMRPIAIFSTPKVEKENKQYAATNSICSGLIKFGIVEAVALPIEKAVKNIDKYSEKFLDKKTIENLIKNTGTLTDSRSYKLMTQIIKLSTGFFTAIPKSMLTLALIPVLMGSIFKTKVQNPKEEKKIQQTTPFTASNKEIKEKLHFTGNVDIIPKMLSKIIDNKHFQNFAKKYETKDKDIAKHITAATDILLTTSFAVQTNNSKKIKENRKKALIYNNVISTAITLGGGYWLDKMIAKGSTNFIEKFKHFNAKDPKLNKYIEGINILRPALIFAGIYYCVLPIFSTYLAEKVDKFIEKQKKS